MASLRQALTNSDIQAPRKFTKAKLYDLYKNLKPTNLSPKTTPAPKVVKHRNKLTVMPRRTPPPSSSSKTSSRRASNSGTRPSASQGRAPDSVDARPGEDPVAAQLSVAAPSSAIPRPTTQAGVWPPPPPVSAPLPTPLSSEPSVQASAWPQCPAYTAPPPASLSSGPAAEACVWPHGQPHSAPQPAPFGSGLTAQASDWLLSLGIRWDFERVLVIQHHRLGLALSALTPSQLDGIQGAIPPRPHQTTTGFHFSPEEKEDRCGKVDGAPKSAVLSVVALSARYFHVPGPMPRVSALCQLVHM
ncbi:hypothetical protein G5714_014917 [Onychostoma macrolepis]|uniref:Uncharacterized protein n=1 Tax=Onychostoma macrolepis TaxID=369639 RepID=A0A7J6C9Q9_9TELE|nr:hypothetical protein G5714_014917 [Onychostoma macrolepis]